MSIPYKQKPHIINKGIRTNKFVLLLGDWLYMCVFEGVGGSGGWGLGLVACVLFYAVGVATESDSVFGICMDIVRQLQSKKHRVMRLVLSGLKRHSDIHVIIRRLSMYLDAKYMKSKR